MISNNILLEVIHKDKFSRGRFREPKISILDTIRETNRNILLKKQSEKQNPSEFGFSREIKGIVLQTKKKFFPLPKLFQSRKESLLPKKKISNIETNMIRIDNNKNFTEFDLQIQMQNTDKNFNDHKLFYESITSNFSLNRNLQSQGDSLANEFCKNDKFFTKLKSISRELPKQKNYAFYSKEPASFKNLKQLNKTRRSTLDLKKLEGQFNPKASDESFTYYSNNFSPNKNEKLKSLSKEKDYKSDNSKEKEVNFVKDHFRLTQKSSKVKNLAYVQKKEKIESIRHRDNIGQKFIEFFEQKEKNKKNELENDSETTNEEEVLGCKFGFDTKTTEEINYFENIKENGLSDIFRKLKNEESTRNLLSEDRISANNPNSIDKNNRDKIYFNSSSIISNVRNSESNFLLKKDQKHFVQRVKKRLERINRL